MQEWQTCKETQKKQRDFIVAENKKKRLARLTLKHEAVMNGFRNSIANRLVVRISCFSVCGLVLSLTNRSEKTTERFQAFDTLTVNRATECLLLHQKSISKSFIILPLGCNIFLLRWIAVQQVKSATEASERYQVTHVIIHLFIIHVILQSWRPVTSWRSQWFCRPIGPSW